jgi:tetratricopeptide (TPR) repeat protein
MSFLRRWFGGSDPARDKAEAEAHFAAGRFYEARVAFERLADDTKASASDRALGEAGVVRAQDALARARIQEAERLLAAGQRELARTELQTAIDTARSEAIIAEARRLIERSERREVRAQQVEVELGDDERWVLLAGNWSDAQLEEYDGYGEAFREALVRMAKGDAEGAKPVLERFAEEAEEDGVYLWLEVARGRSRTEDHPGATRALERFLERVPDEDRSEARVDAYAYLAQLAERGGHEERAIEHLEEAIDRMPDDPRPFLHLGAYLRGKGHAAEAVEVLEAAIGLMDEDRPSWLALQELGLAKRDAGRHEAGIETLEAVIRQFVSRGVVDELPPTTAAPLAALHERAGNLARAADLWAALSRSSDRAQLVHYHREAARVLALLNERSEARRFLARAAALAEDDPALLDAIEQQRDKLDE